MTLNKYRKHYQDLVLTPRDSSYWTVDNVSLLRDTMNYFSGFDDATADECEALLFKITK